MRLTTYLGGVEEGVGTVQATQQEEDHLQGKRTGLS